MVRILFFVSSGFPAPRSCFSPRAHSALLVPRSQLSRFIFTADKNSVKMQSSIEKKDVSYRSHKPSIFVFPCESCASRLEERLALS